MSIEIQTFRSDFEMAAYSFMRSLFPELSVECCFFYFGQANRRKTSELGLQTKYFEDLPPPEAENFAMYFERMYIGQYLASDVGTDELHPLRLTWREPPFPPSIWSVYDRTFRSEPRTTNFLEGWHRHISSILGQSHPNIWRNHLKKFSKAVGRERRLKKVVFKLQLRTNNGHTYIEYHEGLAHYVIY